MGGAAFGEAAQVVAALQDRDGAAAATASRQSHDLPRDPGEILRLELELRPRIAPMRVEAGGDQDQFGPEAVHRRQPDVRHALAALRRPGTGGPRHVRDLVELSPLPPPPPPRPPPPRRAPPMF